jgi:hypothetical protein
VPGTADPATGTSGARGASRHPPTHRPEPRTTAPGPAHDETTPTVHVTLNPPPDTSVPGAVARLSAEFAGRVPERLVDAVVRGSRRDLDSAPHAALPELVERLARQRLLDGAGEA